MFQMEYEEPTVAAESEEEEDENDESEEEFDESLEGLEAYARELTLELTAVRERMAELVEP